MPMHSIAGAGSTYQRILLPLYLWSTGTTGTAQEVATVSVAKCIVWLHCYDSNASFRYGGIRAGERLFVTAEEKWDAAGGTYRRSSISVDGAGSWWGRGRFPRLSS